MVVPALVSTAATDAFCPNFGNAALTSSFADAAGNWQEMTSASPAS